MADMHSAGFAKRLWALEGATLTMDAGSLVVLASGSVTIPSPSFLIEHERGLVLFDTGLAPEAAGDPARVYGEHLVSLTGLQYYPEQRVDRQLEKLGFSTEDVSHVVVSHAHFDHTGGLYLFPNAKLFIGAADLPYVFWPSSPSLQLTYRYQDIEAARHYAWNPLEGDHDLFGDGSIQILSTPGHTPGHSSLLIRLPQQRLLLSGDVVHLRSALHDELPMGIDHSGDRTIRSIQRIKQVADSVEARIWVNHDPDDWKEFGARNELR